MDALIRLIRERGRPVVAGLDPTLADIPAHISEGARDFEGAAQRVFDFNKGLIDALYDVVPAVKPQSAFYEALGWRGVRALSETIDYAKSKGLYVILDGKRGDVGSTAEAYARAYLGDGGLGAAFGADALTVNAYTGSDGVTPFAEAAKKYGKAIFALVKTSNPSSSEIQDLDVGGARVYEAMGRLCSEWGAGDVGGFGYSSVGAVVGATYPEEAAALRAALKRTFFLVPGYGAQGGSAAGAAAAFDESGGGAIVNSSRAIMYAYKRGGDPRGYAAAARREAIRMGDEINAAIRARR